MSEWLDGFSMAWGMFLAIPCPLRRWNEKAREKMLVCLPLVGLAVGGIWLGLYLLLRHAAIGGLYAFLMAAVPWLVTGFMHLDGYMDVCDAVLSRRELATRQRILKDSHCGAFAVIGMVLLALCQWSVFLSGSADESLWGLLLIPVATRACAGLAVLKLRPMGTSQYAAMGRHGGYAAALGCVLGAAVQAHCPDAGFLGVEDPQLIGDLDGKLPGGGQNHRLNALVLRVDMLHNGDAVGKGLACTGGGLGDHVPPFQHGRDAACLHRGGLYNIALH